MVGQFKWDLTGPSYLLPLRRENIRNGFVVADVFTERQLDVHHIRYFIRKVQTYQKTSNSGALFPDPYGRKIYRRCPNGGPTRLD